jgi:hypothetical protein
VLKPTKRNFKRYEIVRNNLLLLLIGIFLFTACRKKDTSWNSDWVAPIVNDTLALNNLVNDSTISAGAGMYYQVDLSRTIFDFGIEDIVTVIDTTIDQSFTIAVSSINVPPGYSFVNEIEEHDFNVKDVQLKKVRVSQGKINIKVFNPLTTKAFFTVQLPGIYKNGILFEEQYEVEAGSIANPGTVAANLDISGYDIDLTGSSGSDYNKIQSRLLVNSDPAGPSITITNNHIFKIEANFKDIKVDYARGYLGNMIFSDTTNYPIELFNAVANGSIDLPSPFIQFDVINGLKVDAKATFTTVKNTNYSGNTVALTGANIGTPFYLDPATGSWNTLSNSTESIIFNNANSNVESYLENLGNVHSVGYKIEMNPWGNTSGGWNEIFPTSRLKVKLKAQMPLAIGADGLTLRDTFDFDVKQDLEKSHVESGILVLNASNAFPFSTDVKIYLLDEAGLTLYIIDGSSTIESSLYGSIDPKDGMKKSNSEVNFILSEAMLTDLALVKKIAVQAEFNTPDPSSSLNQQISIPVGAFLGVKLKAKLNLKAIFK